MVLCFYRTLDLNWSTLLFGARHLVPNRRGLNFAKSSRALAATCHAHGGPSLVIAKATHGKCPAHLIRLSDSVSVVYGRWRLGCAFPRPPDRCRRGAQAVLDLAEFLKVRSLWCVYKPDSSGVVLSFFLQARCTECSMAQTKPPTTETLAPRTTHETSAIATVKGFARVAEIAALVQAIKTVKTPSYVRALVPSGAAFTRLRLLRPIAIAFQSPSKNEQITDGKT